MTDVMGVLLDTATLPPYRESWTGRGAEAEGPTVGLPSGNTAWQPDTTQKTLHVYFWHKCLRKGLID